jgi:hypothetical protein
MLDARCVGSRERLDHRPEVGAGVGEQISTPLSSVGAR